MLSTLALGADIGGSHITTALVDTTVNRVLPHTYYRTGINAKGSATEIVQAWCAAIEQSWAMAGITQSPVGICMPGPFDYDKGICLIQAQDKYQSLFGINVKQRMAAQLGLPDTGVRFINDASGFLKGELLAGSIKGSNNVAGVTLGTGLGSAYSKAGAIADAELWKMPFKSGIAEDYLSTRWFTSEFESRYGQAISGVKELTGPAIRQEDAAPIFDTFAENLALFIQALYAALRCDTVVLGGNITLAAAYFWHNTCKRLESNNCPVKIAQAALGEIAPIIGAATLFVAERLGQD